MGTPKTTVCAYRCVKCAQSNKTADCPKKDRSTPAKCALCLGDQPANFKGCEVYQEILARKTKKPSPYLLEARITNKTQETTEMKTVNPPKEARTTQFVNPHANTNHQHATADAEIENNNTHTHRFTIESHHDTYL